MFAVLFEVYPASDQWDAYLGNAKMLRPELDQVDGFIDNIRYRSLTREGWILSLSNWRDEKSVVRWRTRANHHAVQERGRREILLDYHLRVGQLTADTHIPEGHALTEQRLDVTEIGEAIAVTLNDTTLSSDVAQHATPDAIATQLGLGPAARARCVAWDVFDAVLTPGDLILLASWRSAEDAQQFNRSTAAADARFRQVRIIREYSLTDRREAPQYYPEVERRSS